MYRVVGRRIHHNNQPITLHSVNVIGMELKENIIFGLWTGLTIPQYLAHIKSLKFNCLRLPIGPRVIAGAPVAENNKATWVPGNAYLSGMNALQILDEWIKECEKIGLRYIFDMHYLDDDGNIPDLWYTAEYPESLWISNMVFLAQRYKNNPGFVGIDTKNEPNSNTATWGTGVLATDWKAANERAFQAINAVNDQILIIVEPLSVQGGLKQLTNNPVNIPLSRLVLSPHVYGPDVWWPFGLGFDAVNFPDNMPDVWDEWFGDTAQTQAVWVGEWGGQYGNKLPQDKAWGDKFVDYLRDRGIFDHAYWGWQDDAGPDTGGILADGGYRNVREDKLVSVSKLITPQTKFSNETPAGGITTPTTPPAQASETQYRVIGNKIYHNGNHIQIQGINVVGFELVDAPIMGGLWSGQTIPQFIGRIKTAGFNTIRFPVGPRALEGRPVNPGLTAAEWLPANAYLAGMNSLQILDEVIKECEAIGMRYIFDVHHLRDDYSIPDLWYVPGEYSEAQWLENISLLAGRYKGKPGFVGIDIKNEPSDATATWGTGNVSTDWRIAAGKAFAAMNAVNQDILFILPAIKHTGGFDQMLANLPAGVPDNRLVLTQHIYGPSVWNPNGSDFMDPSFPSNMADIWDDMMGTAIGTRAIFIGEFGGQYGADPKEKLWEDAFVDWIISRGIENFAYWGWGPNAGPTTGGIVGEDYATADQQKLTLLNELKTAFATFSNQTSTPVTPPVVTPPVASGGKYRIFNRHVYHNGHKVQLFGVNLTGFELDNQNFLTGIWTGQTIRQMLTQIKSQKFNALRIPIGIKVCQNVPVDSGFTATWLPDNEYLIGKGSLELLDEVIKECELLGFRYVLDMHQTPIPPRWYTNNYPESQWLADIVTLATRYKGNKGFMAIDLRNEPADSPGGSTWGDGVLSTDWRLAAKRAYDAIAAVNDDIYVIVEPLNASPMLNQLVDPPVDIPVNRLCLSPHIYFKDVWEPFGQGFQAPNFPYNMPAVWDSMFGNVAKTQYVAIGEWGGDYGLKHPQDDDAQDMFAAYLKANDITDFFYWMWGYDSTPTQGLVESDYRTLRTDKMAMLDSLWTPLATYSNQTLTVVTPPPVEVDPDDPDVPPIDPEIPPGLPGGYTAMSRGLYNINYRNILLKLFPKGKAWRIELGSVTAKLLSAIAVELKRVDTAVNRIHLEADPRTADQTLEDWEREYGLPDECSVLAGSIEERRANLIAKITATGGQSENYFRGITGESFSFPIGYRPPTTLPMSVSGSVRGMGFKHIWEADISSASMEWFEAGDPVDTPINKKRETANLQCLIEKYKPAHTYVIYK